MTTSDSGASPERGRILCFVAAASVALVVALLGAFRHVWLTDDAFISFRYAKNLVVGRGLVFNVGESVEGYSNLVWTLWSAIPLYLGLSVEAWAHFWSISCYVASVIVLTRFSRTLWKHDDAGTVLDTIPIAALIAAVSREWWVWASGGLETSFYTFLALVTFLRMVDERRSDGWRPLVSGLLFAVLALTRPDGPIFGGLAGLAVLAWGPHRLRGAVLLAGGFASLWLPHLLWRRWYYGDWLPNTYYAKSAGDSYWQQGIHYVELFARQHWVLIALCLVGVLLLLRRGSLSKSVRQTLALAVVTVLVYSLYVARVGGGFMHARLLVPTLPFLVVAAELVLRNLPLRPLLRGAIVLMTLAGVLLAPVPVGGEYEDWHHGIADEWSVYEGELARIADQRGRELRSLMADLPVRVVFLGSQAREIFHSDIGVAIEGVNGLTDRTIAHQKLEKRGRPGHEKHPTPEYLVSERKAHLFLRQSPPSWLPLFDYIPPIRWRLPSRSGFVLHWDPAMVAALRSRGMVIDDFPTIIDSYLASPEPIPLEELRESYRRASNFYFDHVQDAERQAAFEAAIEVAIEAARSRR